MNVVFRRKLFPQPDQHFATYRYDERCSSNPLFVNIRQIIKVNAQKWLDDLQSSHVDLSDHFVKMTRWWWVSPASRLDARPWGQEPILKPLFFARSVSEWISNNREVKQIVLIGCPSLVKIYLKEFSRQSFFKLDFCFVNSIIFKFYPLLWIIVQSAKWMIKNLIDLIKIEKDHLFRPKPNRKGSVLILHEILPQLNAEESKRYYFGSLFDGDLQLEQSVNYGCTTRTYHNVNKIRNLVNDKERHFLILDYISPFDLFLVIGLNIHLFLASLILSLTQIVCTIKGQSSKLFWQYYIIDQLPQVVCLRESMIYIVLKRLFKTNQFRAVVYPYEEKGVERVILFASKELRIKSIGYAPHPQHRFALALKDVKRVTDAPKPDLYAVCGPAFIDHFLKWAQKSRECVHVWGSDKFSSKMLAARHISRSQLSILLLLSHPEELNIFHSWLSVRSRLTEGIKYYVRLYRSVRYKEQLRLLNKITTEFLCVKESTNDLINDLECNDIVLFSATSAGLVAINHGKLAVHVCLGEFFQINPCFDELGDMLSCESGAHLENRLDELCAMTPNTLGDLRAKQKAVAQNIFSAIDRRAIKETLCYEN